MSGVGAIATSSSAGQRPRLGLDPSGNERLAPVGKHEPITGLDIRRRVFEET